jgi:hypothetical protein
MDRDEKRPKDAEETADEDREREEEKKRKKRTPNPPYTTTGKITSPKFGSAGSGGAEFEPGPEND